MRNRTPSSTRTPALRPLAQAVAAAWLLGSPLWLQAQTAPTVLPSGPQVVAGQASISTQGHQMLVRNSPGAVLNWQSFSIGAAAGVHFDQASAASKVLNRVTGQDPSAIFGSLTSNGQVWLLNPNGVLFGAGARVDVAGLVASTLRLNDNDFLNNRLRLLGDGTGAAVRNEGSIRTAYGGQVLLLGENVSNRGDISTSHLTLASASQVELVDTGLPYLTVRVEAPAGETVNLGRLVADGGTVDIFGTIVNQQGLVQADSMGTDAQGRIVLKAADTLTLGAGSVTRAVGGAGLTGGSVDLLGPQVALTGNATVDVSGGVAGGGIRLGGGLQGRDTSVPNSRAVWLGPDATLRADATGAQGTGGRILVWSDEATRAYGTLSARGGTAGGDGGFVETSGGWLDARPTRVDLSSRGGVAGQWLLDPNNILINDTGPDANISGGPNFTSTNDSAVIGIATLAAALNAGSSVTVQTASGGSNSQAGDIRMTSTLSVNPTAPVTLTLRANRDVVVRDSTITSTGAALSLDFVSAAGGVGAIEVNNSTITTAGGNITLRGANAIPVPLPDGSFTSTPFPVAIGYDRTTATLPAAAATPERAVRVQDSTLVLGNGSFTAYGLGPTAAPALGISEGVRIDRLLAGSSSITAGTIDVRGWSRATNAYGLLVSGLDLSTTGDLSLVGAGLNRGAFVDSSTIQLNAAAGSGAQLLIDGLAGTGPNAVQFGVLLQSASRATSIVVSNADVVITGRHLGNGPGVRTTGADTLLDFRSAGPVTISGQSASGSGIALDALVLNGPNGQPLTLTAGSSALSITSSELFGSGAWSLSGSSVSVATSTLASTGAPLTVAFDASGSSPAGVQLLNTILTTNNGDITFGASQTLPAGVLPATTVARNWVRSSGSPTALDLQGSTLDAGTGTIRGGGAGSGTGTYILDSVLSAAHIDLAGRSDTAIGFIVEGSTLTATRTLSLAATNSNSAAEAMEIAPRSTLQLVDPNSTAGSAFTLAGRNEAAGPGVVVRAGPLGGVDETRIIVSGASATIDGSAAAGGNGVWLQGDGVSGGGLLLNLLGATSASIVGTVDSDSGVGLLVQYTNLLGPQASAGAPLLLQGNGLDTDALAGNRIEFSTVSTGGTLTVRGRSVHIDNSLVTGESGVSILTSSFGGSGTAGYIWADQSLIRSEAAGASTRLEAEGGGAAQGNALRFGGTGITLTASQVDSTGAGGTVVINGQGASGGGHGVTFNNATLAAANLNLTGTAALAFNGVYSDDGGSTSTLRFTNLQILGTSPGGSNSNAGVWLSRGVQLQGSDRGTATVQGDTVRLGDPTVASSFTATGNLATFQVFSSRSLVVQNALLDFSDGTGTTVLLRADSDGNDLGRARLASSTVITGGGSLTATGTGVSSFDVNNQPIATNSAVLEGASGVLLTGGVTINAGSGDINFTGAGAGNVGGTQPGGWGVNFGGQVQLTGGQVRINGSGTGGHVGVEMGGAASPARVNINSDGIQVVGQGAGLDGAGAPNPGVSIVSTPGNSIWRANNGGNITIDSGGNSAVNLSGLYLLLGTGGGRVDIASTGALQLTNSNVDGQNVAGSGTRNVALSALGPLTLVNTPVAATGSLTVSATGTGANGSLISARNSLLRADGALGITGTSTDGSTGVALLEGTTVQGTTVSIIGGGGGLRFNDALGTSSVVASDNIALEGRNGGTGPSVAISGGWSFTAGTRIDVDSDNGLALTAGGQTGLRPTFVANQGFLLDTVAPLGLTLANGSPLLDGTALGSALAGMPAASTTTLRITGNANTLTVNGPLVVPNRLRVQADGIELQTNALLRSTATGDAIVLGGTSADSFTFLDNTGGAGVLNAPAGRWVLLADGPANTNLGGLSNAFTAYGLQAAPWAIDAQGNYITPAIGNALGYAVSAATAAGAPLSGLLTRVYDTTTAITLDTGTWAITGLVPGNFLAFTGPAAASLADKNVGAGKPVTLNAATGFVVFDGNGGPVFGYGTPSFTATITPASVTATGATAASRAYDGTTTATLTSRGSVTPLAGDTLTLAGGTASFADKNVGTGKAVTVSGVTLAGTDAANYVLTGQPAFVVADITPLSLSVGGLTAASKVYDTTTTAVLTGSATISPVAGDSVSLAGTATGTFADRNAGTAKAVTVTGFTLAGTDARNYTLSAPVLSADITRAPLALGGLTAQSKTYDANTVAGFLGTPVVSPLGNDVVSLSGTAVGSFADKNAGTGKAVALSGLSLTGPDAANYTLQAPAYTASITQASLGLQGVAAADKAYDGTRTAAVSGTLSGVLPGDAVTVGFAGLFADANVGSGKTVNWTATLAGTDAANYSLAPALGGATAAITPATLLYVASPVVGTAGQALPTLGGTVSGFQGSDTLASATTGTLGWTTSATSGSAAGAYAITGGGLAALNYVFAQAPGNAGALVLRQPAAADPTTTTTTVVVASSLVAVQPPVVMSTPTSGRVLDVTPAFSPQPLATAGTSGTAGTAGAGGTSGGTGGGSGGLAFRLNATGGVFLGAAGSTATAGGGTGGGAGSGAAGGAAGGSAGTAAAVAAPGAVAAALASQAAGSASPGLAFEALDWSALPRDEVQTLLAARARYKQNVFSRGVFKLKQDPTLADVRACRTPQEIDTGVCLITEELKRQIQAARAQAQAAAAGANRPAREGQRRVLQAALPRIERKLALLIGVNQYADKRVPELVGAVPDARAVRTLLEQRLGYETTVLEDPSREAIVRAFNRLAAQAEANDSVIIYYAGHGVVVPIDGVDTGFWLPADSDAESPSSWLANSDIAKLVASISSRQTMLVSDSCYSGTLVGRDRVSVSGGGNADELLSRRAAVIMSSGGDEPVADQGKSGHSVFAWHFMQALQGLNDWQVGNNLFDRVRDAVVKEFPQTPQYGASRTLGHQGNTDYLFERRELEKAAR